MIVAMRRSIRVGPRAGSPLEEFGVAPDVSHRMTKRDVLDDNLDLLARAAGIIRQSPSFQLSVKMVSGERREIVVRAASQVPSSRAGRRIARLDIYINNRPVRSVDAENGAVPPTRVKIARTRDTPVVVKAQAWDHVGRLVAIRRTRVR